MDKELFNILAGIKKKLISDFPVQNDGHDIGHMTRTVRNALTLQNSESGDIYVIAISALLHDVHRLMGIRDNKYYTPKESIPTVKSYLSTLDLTSLQKDKICFAIEHHEEYSFGEETNGEYDIETLILQDSDNLDAIGGVGLVRTLQYSLTNSIKIYDPSVELYRNEYSEKTPDASCVHHIYNKLMRLGENMNTKTAKLLAEPKIQLMKDFVNMFISEYNINFD